MSENSPPTPVNATIDLEQLQSLIAAQAQVNSTQEFCLSWQKKFIFTCKFLKQNKKKMVDQRRQ